MPFSRLLTLVGGRSGLIARKMEDIGGLGEVVPDTMHPVIDHDRCIGSGACVRACPENVVIEIVHGQAKLVNALACVGHSACMQACPVQAIKVVFDTATRGVELPRVDRHFQTTRAGVYVKVRRRRAKLPVRTGVLVRGVVLDGDGMWRLTTRSVQVSNC